MLNEGEGRGPHSSEPAQQLEARVQLLSTNLAIMRAASTAMVGERDRDRLIQRVTEVLAGARHCRSVWIALLGEQQRVTHHAIATPQGPGNGLGALFAGGKLPPCGARALAQAESLLVRRSEDPCNACGLWPECAHELLLCCALRSHETTYGVLAACFAGAAEGDPDTRALLAEIAEDLACALRALDEEAKRQNVEAALRESEKLYRTLVETSPDSITLTDLEGNFVAANESAAHMHGVPTVEAFLGRCINAFELIAPEDRERAAQLLAETWRTGTCRNIEYTMIRRDGSSFPAELDASLVVDADGNPKGFVGIVRDISERKRAERERAQIQAQLRQKHKLESIGVLASGVAHEINNPVNVIMNYATLTLRSVPSDGEVAEHARQILAESKRVADIVRSLLTFGRKEVGSYQQTPIADLVRSVLQLMGTTLDDDGIDLQVVMAADLPPVWCHSGQIQQVLMNLVANARDALNLRYPAGGDGKVLRIGVAPLDEPDQRWVRVTVEDHGPGISAPDLERVFDPFYTSKAAQGGTGLGLSVSHGIVADHGGRLTVESREGLHTRFHMDLPVAVG